LKILVNSAVDAKCWNTLLKINSFATPFQSPEYFEFINSVPGFSAEVFAVEEKNELQALCVVTFQKEKGIRSFFSKRAIIYGGPLFTDTENGEIALNSLLVAINKKIERNVIYIETRNLNDYSSKKDCFYKNGWKYEPYLNIQILLKGKSRVDILGSMKYNRRREIQLSIKEGVTSKEAENVGEVSILYYILFELYKKRIGLPLPGLDFFINLFYSPIGKVFIIKHKEQVIGGSFCLFFPDKPIYTIYYCSLRNYHPRIFPTHLAILAAIDFGLKNNLNKLDFMGAGKPDIEYGVRAYKLEFGGELVEQGRFIRIVHPLLFKVGKFGLTILKKIK
jgi:serine/alanine adding enzyme